MRKVIPIIMIAVLMIGIYGCDKEKIVNSTETVHEIQYIMDTVVVTDTVSSIVQNYDTTFVHDTSYVHDTVYQTNTVYDTSYVTVTQIDTVEVINNNPNENYAYTAMQYYTDTAVIAFINGQFGYSDGWVLYLSSFMSDISNPSTGVYDFYGVIDYWTPDWSGYYPIEYGWRMTYTGGDPSNPQSWDISEPPTPVSGKPEGLRFKGNTAIRNLSR